MKCVMRQLAFVVFLLSLAGPPASVPEIDVGSGVSAIALLLGGGALLGERLQSRTKRPLV